MNRIDLYSTYKKKVDINKYGSYFEHTLRVNFKVYFWKFLIIWYNILRNLYIYNLY